MCMPGIGIQSFFAGEKKRLSYQKALINQGQIAVLANLKGITEPKFIQLGQKFIQNAFLV